MRSDRCIAVTKSSVRVNGWFVVKVCANPNNQLNKDTIEAPIVQNNAILFGCDFSPFRYMYTANNAIY